MKIAILWTKLSGYLNACLKALVSLPNVSLLVVNQQTSHDAPFDESQFAWIKPRYQWQDKVDAVILGEKLNNFYPDVLLISGWHIKGYRSIARQFSGKALRVIAMDNQWRGTAKQWLGCLTAPFFVQRLADAIFLPGERQKVFAQKLGFKVDQILSGLLCCEHNQFAEYGNQQIERKNSFVYVGRLAGEKGIKELLYAYDKYRKETQVPWELVIIGTGPLSSLVQRQNEVIYEGFVQPNELPKLLAFHGCLILPSLFEPWGVVLHEATSARLPVIATDNVGATVHLLQDGYNGYLVEVGNIESLASAMKRISTLSYEERCHMGENGYRLSLQYTPQRWATYFHEKIQILLEQLNRMI
ncbi:glycosyl transferase [Thioploca ingrica]|uniref:Glycosyl transferase n=1 Tax=Thioploca ingrica TaxID=40754 RepID=A0A090ALK2_9GAMM|nr:glycosyl transferase [Thioploca ingrica]